MLAPRLAIGHVDLGVALVLALAARGAESVRDAGVFGVDGRRARSEGERERQREKNSLRHDGRIAFPGANVDCSRAGPAWWTRRR